MGQERWQERASTATKSRTAGRVSQQAALGLFPPIVVQFEATRPGGSAYCGRGDRSYRPHKYRQIHRAQILDTPSTSVNKVPALEQPSQYAEVIGSV